MHVLIITSEELNEMNTLPSIFELNQAKALRKSGIETAILSVGTISTREVFRSFLFRLAGRNDDSSRCRQYSTFQLFLMIPSVFLKSWFHIPFTRAMEIEGIPVYESVICRNNAFHIRQINKRIWLKQLIKSFKRYLKEKGVPDIIHAHNRYLRAGQIAVEIKKLFNIPYILTDHSSYYIRNLVKNSEKNDLVEGIENAAIFSTVSKKLGEWVNSSLNKNFRPVVLPNSLNIIYEREVPERTAVNGDFTFLSVASLDKNKGHELLIQAFSEAQNKNPGMRLMIAGDGPEKGNIRQLIEKLGIKEKVVLLGKLDPEEIRKEMLSSNCLVITSEFETFGVVAIESMACGRPVISTMCGGPEELINEKNGMLVPRGDVNALAAAMEKMFRNPVKFDPAAIRDQCLHKYSSSEVVKSLINNYHSVLSQ